MVDDDGYLEARTRTIAKMHRMCDWISLPELLERMHEINAADNVAQWEAEQRIFSIPSESGILYPLFEFDGDMQPLPIIKDVLQILSNGDPMAIAAWFIFKNGWIAAEELVEGKEVSLAPMCALHDRETVLNAARNSKGTHFA